MYMIICAKLRERENQFSLASTLGIFELVQNPPALMLESDHSLNQSLS